MASSFTANKDLEKPAHNDYVDDWDIPVNGNTTALDACLSGTSYVNLTSASTYTLSYTDLQARTIVFTGTLNNATVTVLLTNGVSFEGQIVNVTAAAGSSSILELGWTGAGNTFDIPQGASVDMIADGLNPSVTGWQPVSQFVRNATFGTSAGIGPITSSFSVTGAVTQNISLYQAKAGLLIFTGTVPNAAITYILPAGFPAIWDVYYNLTAAGGSSTLLLSCNSGGFQIPNSVGGLRAITDGTHGLVKVS